jgi:hypothetical protein
MIQFKPLDQQAEWDFFKERTHVIQCEDSQGIVAFDERGIQAVAVFDTWTVDSCSVHYCIPNPMVLRRGFFREVGDYLFNRCNRTHIFGLVPSNNEKALKFDRHIGMHDVAVIPDAVRKGVDYVVMRMNKEDCRWIDQPVKEERAA